MSTVDFSDTASSDFDISSMTSSHLNPGDTGVGLSDATLSQNRRKLLDLVNRLHATGVQKDLDLPQIAVIGSQSAGKSSLIESISGITLPRAAGTCTRCPTECKLSHSSEAWKCTISLRFSTGKDGRPLTQVRNETFGPTITEKSEVEERIRRAQRAILNPDTPYRQFLEGEDSDLPRGNDLSFSTNCVSLSISGPSVADLSFCDLPGLIASVSSSGQEGDIKLIENLVSSYITKPSCIILLTVACETDFENQGAHRITKAADPEGKRTIGVLTKPDRIPPGEEDRWIAFIRNEREPLENNWYSVKQPNSRTIQQGVTWSQAREQERVFFSQTSPWSGLDAVYQAYLGTGNLVNRLSMILSDLIAKRLPEIQEELQQLIHATEASLAELPKPPSDDPFAEILVKLQDFVRDVGKHVEGIPDATGLLQKLRPQQKAFRKAIRETAPEFRPFPEGVDKQKSLMFTEPQFLSNEEEEDGDEDEIEGTEDEDTGDEIYIDQVMTRAQDARTRELPGNYPFSVKLGYITEFVQKWDEPAQDLCLAEYGIVNEYFKHIVAEHFTGFGASGLDQRVKLIIAEHVKTCFNNALEKVKWLLALEAQPATLNTHYFCDYRDKFFSYYKAARDNDVNAGLMKAIENYTRSHNQGGMYETTSLPTGIANIMTGLRQVGVYSVRPEDLVKALPPDPMESALNIMADVRGYFHVAYKRFVDNVPLALDHELVMGLTKDLLTALLKGLKLNGPNAMEVCKELMQENRTTAAKRAELTKKLERLRSASFELLALT